MKSNNKEHAKALAQGMVLYLKNTREEEIMSQFLLYCSLSENSGLKSGDEA